MLSDFNESAKLKTAPPPASDPCWQEIPRGFLRVWADCAKLCNEFGFQMSHFGSCRRAGLWRGWRNPRATLFFCDLISTEDLAWYLLS